MKKIRAFTLIELLIVITIIGILAVAFVPQLLGSPSKARDTKRVDDINNLYGVFAATEDAGNELMGGNTWRCVGDLNLNEADFGGVLPEDPQYGDDLGWWTYGDLCNDSSGPGGYIILDADHFGSGDYSWTIVTGVENFEFANSDCSRNAIVLGIGLEGPTEGYNAGSAYKGNCYIRYVQ